VTFLLDTHAWLWFILDDPQLTERARLQIENPAHRILLSPASVWELAIKISIGKYQLAGDLTAFVREQLVVNRVELLPIAIEHATRVCRAPIPSPRPVRPVAGRTGPRGTTPTHQRGRGP
jgi:PIN domain nuclease of toxin-antitoxin system